ncbi:hypothetical protein M8C21_016742, partial [Ambrosia artemisiifolia]
SQLKREKKEQINKEDLNKRIITSRPFSRGPQLTKTPLLPCKRLPEPPTMQISGGVLTDVTAMKIHMKFVNLAGVGFDDCFLSMLLTVLRTEFELFGGSRGETSRAWSCIAKASPAIDQQLDNLQNERDAQKQEPPPSSTDSLYRRIAQVKEKDRQKVLEEIMYCWIVQKFIDKEISMIPKLSPSSDPTGRVDFWPNQELKLESVHSAEALEMIQNHVALVMGDRLVGPLESLVQISKIKLGKLYAASIMYGYFLKRVDERFQLERSMNTLPEGFKDEQSSFMEPSVPLSPFLDPDSLIRIQPDYDDEGLKGSYGDDSKSYRLRSYVMQLDVETLQRYATIRSKEAISLIEKQTQALFGKPDIKVSEDGLLGAGNDEVVSVTFSGLTMLILEAVAFGSFLWEAENYVESKYQFLRS